MLKLSEGNSESEAVPAADATRLRKAEVVAPDGPIAARAGFERALVVARAVAPEEEARAPEAV